MFKKLFFLIFLTNFSTFLQAQYTHLINSNCPGFSQSPYSVGTGVYQLESNFFYQKAEPISMFDNPSMYGVNLNFRTTFFLDRLELNAHSSFQNDELTFQNVFTSSKNETGLGQLTVGAKYLVFVPKYEDKSKEVRSWKKRHAFDKKRWIPHIALYAGYNFGDLLNKPHQNGGNSYKVGLLLQNEFDLRYNLITNIYYNYIGTDYTEWSYIITGTYIFSQRWSGFMEHEAKFNQYTKMGNVGVGLAYLFDKNLQVNSSVRAIFRGKNVGHYISLGISYRIDNHVDDYIELNDFGEPVDELIRERRESKRLKKELKRKLKIEEKKNKELFEEEKKLKEEEERLLKEEEEMLKKAEKELEEEEKQLKKEEEKVKKNG